MCLFGLFQHMDLNSTEQSTHTLLYKHFEFKKKKTPLGTSGFSYLFTNVCNIALSFPARCHINEKSFVFGLIDSYSEMSSPTAAVTQPSQPALALIIFHFCQHIKRRHSWQLACRKVVADRNAGTFWPPNKMADFFFLTSCLKSAISRRKTRLDKW